MQLETILTFLGILIAAVAVARPVQRHSIALFVPRRILAAALLLSFTLLVFRDAPLGIPPPFGWSLPIVAYCLTLGSFLIPVGAAAWGWFAWLRAKVSPGNADRLEGLFQAAVQEGEFYEVERVLRKNRQNLTEIPAGAAGVLFSPDFVDPVVDSGSLIHLELLSSLPFLNRLDDRFVAVDVVVRKLLKSDKSPLRSAIVSKYGGLDTLKFPDAERALMDSTFLNPRWYLESFAHYPLVITAVEELQSGKFDVAYNDSGIRYEAAQGVSMRAFCPIYLAEKTEVLAIEAALRGGFADQDFYVTDLFDIFREVQDRSKFGEAWSDRRNSPSRPTPYSYLLYEIVSDLRHLAATAVIGQTQAAPHPLAAPPSAVARAIALTWSYCVWYVSHAGDKVSPDFKARIIEPYLVFVLELGWQPSDIYFDIHGNRVGGLDAWRDLFVKELRGRFSLSGAREKGILVNALDSLDQGKRYVAEGSDWLREKIGF